MSALHLLLVGGFAYFRVPEREIVQINALSMMPSRNRICLEGPLLFDDSLAGSLQAADRMCKVTLDSLEILGLTSFCWIHPEEVPKFVPNAPRTLPAGLACSPSSALLIA